MDEYKKTILNIAKLLEIDCSQDLEESLCSTVYNAVAYLKKDDDMLNMAIDNCIDSFHVTDGEGNIVRVNRAFTDGLQIARKDVEGKNVVDMEKSGIYSPTAVHVAIREKRMISMIQTGARGKAIASAQPVLDPDGNVMLVVSNARFLSELQLLENYFEIEKERHTEVSPKSMQMISKSKLMRSLMDLAGQVAKADSSILITGETGTGKSMLAKYIHAHSKRKDEKFIEINCAAIPENLIESELFGYTTGAFTGAKKGGKPGLIELANNGTLFLDEIGDMPLNLQAKLLQVLQNRSITRIGGEEAIDVNIRLITATNSNLEEMIEKGAFRSELYYRINVVPLHVPALRNRREDISDLVDSFTQRFNSEYNTNVIIGKETMKRLEEYKWPGNIRELENLIERLVVTDGKGIVELEDLPNAILIMTDEIKDDITVNKIIPLKKAMDEVERQLINAAYEAYGSSYKVARALGISQSGASRKHIKYQKDLEK